MTRPEPRYCCRKHTPPFHRRLAEEVRRHWRGHLARAAGNAVLLAAVALAAWRLPL